MAISKITNPHDRFFKKTFKDIRVVKSFVQNYFPCDIIDILDINSLESGDESFITDELKEYFSDIVLRARLKHGGDFYISLLFEHKSEMYEYVSLQLLRYMQGSWDGLKSKKDPLPVFIPSLIYHGKQRWKASKSLSALFDKESTEKLEKYFPNYEYLLFDLSHMTESEIKGEIKLKAFIEVVKGIFFEYDEGKIVKLLMLLDDLEKKEKAIDYVETVLRYLFDVRKDITPEKLIQIDKKHNLEKGEIIMTVAEQLRKEGYRLGMKEGMEEGMKEGERKKALDIAKNMLKLNINIETIEQVTGLSREEIEKVK